MTGPSDVSRHQDQLEAGMSAAGFHLQPQPGGHVEPGIWLASASAAGEKILVPVDLIVPEGAASGTGRRAAPLGGHGARAARRAVGLEAALIDNSTMTIAALDPADERSLQARVAGPAGRGGLWQRISIATGFGWLSALSLRALTSVRRYRVNRRP